jgi:F420-dependent oxidoreductase-like protein
MRFGIFTSLTFQTWPAVRHLWQHLERTGWDMACVSDHFMPNTKDREGPVLEAWSTLTALAATVPRMRVGTIVLGNPYRHPAVLAKMAAQVDIVTEGRLLLGLGAGWQRNEHEAYGIPYGTMRERLEKLDETCEVIRSLWTKHRSDFNGRYYQLSNAPLEPKPVQKPYPELMIGGGGERVTLRIVAKHADHWNVWGGPKILARKTAILEEHCRNVGRDSRTIGRSVNMALQFTDKQSDVDRLAETVVSRLGSNPDDARDTCLAGTPEQIRQRVVELQQAGATALFIPTFLRPYDDLLRDIDRLMSEVVPAFR